MSLIARLKLGSELKSTVSIDKFNTLYTYIFQNNKKCKGRPNILGARAWLGQGLWGCPGWPGPGAATAADPQRPQGGACARLFHRRRLKWAERRLLVCMESLWHYILNKH